MGCLQAHAPNIDGGHNDLLLPAELRSWAEQVGLDAPALDVIEQVRRGDPARRPQSGTRNTVGRWPSRKMGVTIGCESGHVERSAIVLMEHDPAGVEFYEQPIVLSLDYLRAADASWCSADV